MVLYLILTVLGLTALATVVLGVFMLMDARKAVDKDDFASRMTKAVDSTAKANGLWNRRMRISATLFLAGLVAATLLAVYLMQNYNPTWSW